MCECEREASEEYISLFFLDPRLKWNEQQTDDKMDERVMPPPLFRPLARPFLSFRCVLKEQQTKQTKKQSA